MNRISSGITDVGLKREGNEDAFSADDELGLYVVADGMGGHLAGEVASRVAVDLLGKTYRAWKDAEPGHDHLFGRVDHSLSTEGNYILSGIRLANRVIYEMARSKEEYEGMGTTVAALAVSEDLIIAANVGDSRIYLIRNEGLERLSRDHTIVAEQVEMGVMTEEEADASPMKHILTRNLGSAEDVDAEVFEIEPANGDRFLLFSDGITDLVSDEEILAMAIEEESPDALCRNFVNKALKRGGHDNATVICLSLRGMVRPQAGIFTKMGGVLADIFINTNKFFKKFTP